ncbi:zinc finger, CCHC-type containing protein [Tanacetum coccineum]
MLRSCALEWTGNWDECLCLVEFAYNNSWHASIKGAPFELLYGRRCRSPISWNEVGERVIEGPELVEVTNEKVAIAKEKLKEARSRQKSYADRHRRDLEFKTEDRVFLKIREDLSFVEEPEAILDRQERVPLYVAHGLIMEIQQSQADVEKIIADAIQQERENLRSEISSQINDAITNHIPSQVDSCVRNYIPSAVHPRDQDDPHDDAHPEGGMMQKRKRHLSMEPLYSYATDDDKLPTEKVSQELVDEMSQTVDEAKLHKVVNEMLRQRYTLEDEHQYHIDQMQNFLKNDIVWESRKEILVSPYPQRPTPFIQSCQIDPKAPTLSLVNQDLLYLKKGSSGPEKIVMSLHKFPAVIFPDDDIKERTFRWVDKCVKKAPGKPKEEVYSNSKIDQIIKSCWELGHVHKFIIEIVARRANGSIVSIIESDYKNINKNDIEDMYLLIVHGKVDDYAETGLLWSLPVFIRSIVIWERVHDFQLGVEGYQQKVNLTAPTITFLDIEKYKLFSIVSEPVYGIIYKNSKG